jgi:hypothetical protein
MSSIVCRETPINTEVPVARVDKLVVPGGVCTSSTSMTKFGVPVDICNDESKGPILCRTILNVQRLNPQVGH